MASALIFLVEKLVYKLEEFSSPCGWLTLGYSFVASFSNIVLKTLVKMSAMLIQLVGAIIFVLNSNTSPSVAIALCLIAFIFGFMEGALDLWRA